MKLLKWGGKDSEQFWDISAPALEDKAYKELFAILDEQGCYYDISENLDDHNTAKVDLAGLQKYLGSFKFTNNYLKDEITRWVINKEEKYKWNDIAQIERQAKAYAQAKKGSVPAMKDLIHLRTDYEYETVSVVKL